MAASATQPDHHGAATGADRPRGAKHRRPLLNHLHIQVPTIPANSGWFGRHSGPATAPCGAQASAHGHRHAADQPASPSLLRSPSAWIRAKGHSFGPGKHAHRRAGNFHYDARSYAQNFDEGGGEEDAPRHQCFSPRIATAPQLAASPSSYGTGGRGNGA